MKKENGAPFAGRGSYVRYILVFIALFLAAQTAALVLLFSFNARYIDEQFLKIADNVTEVCENRLDTLLKQADSDLRGILERNAQIRVLSGANRNSRIVAAYELSEALNACLSADSADAYALYSGNSDTFLIARAGGVSYAGAKAMEAHMASLLETGVPSGAWSFARVGGKTYLTRHYAYASSAFGAYFSMETLKKLMPYDGLFDAGQSVAFENGGETLFMIGQRGENDDCMQRAARLDGLTIVYSRDRGREGLGAFVPVYIAAVCLLAMATVCLLLLYLRREVIRPVGKLVKTANVVREGDLTCRARLACHNPDLRTLADAMNGMIDTIVRQRIEAYEQIIGRKEAELKYLQAQIRPHFFLNALSSINGMTWSDDMPRIRRFIDLFSRHIRYLFSAGYQTVPLREEAEQLRSYLECQEILYPECVFSCVELAEGTEEWPVPMLLLHTFVENVYKHTVSFEKSVSLFIRASLELSGGEKTLLIQIEDDGIGFPQSVLETVERYDGRLPDNGKRIGILNIAHTLFLMYGQNGLLRLSNGENGGGRVTVRIPPRAAKCAETEVRAL